jgi:hypothetical protein
MASTTAWEPKRRLSRSISVGSWTAAVLMPTLSAPARRSSSASSTERTPPPTVKGRNTVSATRRTMSRTMGRASEEAVMSRNTSSSAPSAS